MIFLLKKSLSKSSISHVGTILITCEQWQPSNSGYIRHTNSDSSTGRDTFHFVQHHLHITNDRYISITLVYIQEIHLSIIITVICFQVLCHIVLYFQYIYAKVFKC